MGNNPKLMLAPLVAALLIYFIAGPLLGLAVLVIGIAALAMINKREGGGGGDGGTKTKVRKGRKVNEFPTDLGGSRKAPAAGGLPTWSPGGLDTWTPPSFDDTDTGADTATPTEDEPVLEDTWGSWSNDWGAEADVDTLDSPDTAESVDSLDTAETGEQAGGLETWTADWDKSGDTFEDESPLSRLDDLDAEFEEHFGSGDRAFDSLGGVDTDDTIALDDLDDLDAFDTLGDVDAFDELAGAESVEAQPAKSGGFSFSSAPPVVNEAVSSADDIMAASEATELHVPEAGDSELAKLLAKVQARLTAYE